MLGVHQRTLYLWDVKGLIETLYYFLIRNNIRLLKKKKNLFFSFYETIRTIGNKRLYNVKKYIEKTKCSNNNICENLEELDKIDRLNICYVRVSSNNQKDDLVRQKNMMQQKISIIFNN